MLPYFTLILILVATTANGATSKFYECVPGMESAGVSIPRGDIDVEVGSDSFPLYCHMNPDYEYYKNGARSDRLAFYSKGKDDASPWRKLDSSIVNETTIMAIFNPETPRASSVRCSIDLGPKNGGLKGICAQQIFVGYKPLAPENLTCIAEGWSSLNCSWDVPYNPIKTSYVLDFLEATRTGNFFECPPVNKTYCSLNSRSHPPYRRYMTTYHFFMHVKNGLVGEYVQYKMPPLDHYSVVRPPPPAKVSFEPLGTTKMELNYTVDSQLHYFPAGLVQDVWYKSEYSPSVWKPVDINFIDTLNEEENATIVLRNLKPFTDYTVKIRMRSAKADPENRNLWSETVEITQRTAARIPDLPPKTKLGSFEVVNYQMQNRSVYVYWQQLPKSAQNGPEFGYRVTEVREGGLIRPHVPTKMTNAYALFENLGNTGFTFDITSENKNGSAESTSRVFVPPPHLTKDLQPKSFTKIAYFDKLFEVSWFPPTDEKRVVNYTVFYCLSENHRDRPYQCEGQLYWKDVPRYQRSVNITLPTNNVYQFAVAANTETYSSGMVWATCTILHNKVIGKLKTVTVDVVEKDSMTIRWRLDCSDRVGIVRGYRIEYCPISPDSLDCIGKVLEEETAPDAESAVISNLDPWTIYKVGVAVITKAGTSEFSDPIVNRTLRSRPTYPPRNLKATRLAAASNQVLVKWSPPVKANGPVQHYEVTYGFTNFNDNYMEKTALVPGERLTLNNLMFHTTYTIEVRVCIQTVDSVEALCGKDRAVTKIKTGYGESGRMAEPVVTFVNQTEVEVAWNPGLFPQGGPVRRYEVKIAQQGFDDHLVTKIAPGHVSKMKLSLTNITEEQNWSPDCTNKTITNLYNFTVRAISFDPDSGEEFTGSPWSHVDVVAAPCGRYIPWIWIITIVAIIALTAVFSSVYFFKCCRSSIVTSNLFKQVDKEVGMPKNHAANGNGLANPGAMLNGTGDPSSTDKKDWTEMSDMPSPQSGKKQAYQRAGSKDSMEELLDRKMTNGRNASGQSDSTSGCDSGRSYESENEPSDNSENQQMRMNQLNLNQSQQQLLLQQHLNARLPQPPSQSPYVQHGSIQPPLAQGYARAHQIPSEQQQNVVPYSHLNAEGRLQPNPGANGFLLRRDQQPQQQQQQQPQIQMQLSRTGPGEGYTRFSQVLEQQQNNPALMQLPPGPPSQPPQPYVALAGTQQLAPSVLLDHQGQAITETGNDYDSSGSATPIVLSPTTTAFPLPSRPAAPSSGYITLDQASKMPPLPPSSTLTSASHHQIQVQNPTTSTLELQSPRAYSKVGLNSNQRINRISPEQTGSEQDLENGGPLVMSAKDLQVETRAPYRKVVTTLDGAGASCSTSSTKSTMV